MNITSANGNLSGSRSNLANAVKKENGTTKDRSMESNVNGNLSSKWTQQVQTDIHTIKFSLDDTSLAAGLGDGSIQIYQPKTGQLLQTLRKKTELQVPCTSMTWRPSSNGQAKNVLAAVYPDGYIYHWNPTAEKETGTICEDDNQIFAIDYFRDGTKFVTAGSDCNIRIYDEITRKLSAKLFAGYKDVTAGHSNRIFAVKFHPSQPNLVVSGGWDNTIQIWDIRCDSSIRSIYKPHVCGDSIDFDESGEKILTGEYSKEQPLNIWSFQHGTLVETIPWSITDEKKSCLLYSAMFSKPTKSSSTAGNRFICAGGGGAQLNEAKLFNTTTKRCVGYVSNLPSAIFSVNISNNEKLFAIGGSFRELQVFDVDANYTQEFVY
ncbi:WD40-repeat-containing domain protein [Paraphysoderma sedebokerense]|nr:WD40-repeat-containing domain protein [Paraphysoderma sedebokerense]